MRTTTPSNRIYATVVAYMFTTFIVYIGAGGSVVLLTTEANLGILGSNPGIATSTP